MATVKIKAKFSRDLQELLRCVPGEGRQLVAEWEEPAQEPVWDTITPPLPPELDRWLSRQGWRLYRHQAEVLRCARRGENVVLVTPTSSGKTLAFSLPVLERLLQEKEATALFLYPLKALAYDQLAFLKRLDKELEGGLHPAVYDGDTPGHQRRGIRYSSRLILSNPHAMHCYLRFHHQWARFWSHLRFVVVDEAHWYRGIFGAHVAYFFRRLRRLLQRYGADPQFILASATMADPALHAARLIGKDFLVVEGDGAARGRKRYLVLNTALCSTHSPFVQAARLLTACVEEGWQVLCFTGSRKLAELIALWAGGEAKGVSPYRAGYPAAVRRAIESRLKRGELRGVVTTNAMELGVDLGGLDAVLMVGYPGTVASFRQQAGRAGRGTRDSVVMLLATEEPLNQYFARHPQRLFSAPLEQAVIPRDNPHVLLQHLRCAADELPLAPADASWFGSATARCLEELEQKGFLHRTRRGYVSAETAPPALQISLDAFAEGGVRLLHEGEVLEEVEYRRACLELYPGAIYLHQGRAYRVLRQDLDRRCIFLGPAPLNCYTEARRLVDVSLGQVAGELLRERLLLAHGEVAVMEKVLEYVERRVNDRGEGICYPLPHAPTVRFATSGLWLSLSPGLLAEAGPGDPAGALHAVEHLLIAAAPCLTMADRWDLGGLSTLYHPQTGRPGIFLYDAFPGGSGICERLFASFPQLLEVALELVSSCRCEDGCPSCVMSPKCGSGNRPLDKGMALRCLQLWRFFFN
ncbi:DEAD/DEAH box helicase [Desulfothermobacter acidiphilus]|uniref:DEAD/DEAH box helicase n=1 Tax=Desulfothermobacter acidiphilus TaxID=1938353 RepID=UPI003F8C0F12